MTQGYDRQAKPDLQSALDAARRPIAKQQLPAASLRVRLGTSPGLRRLVPRALAVRRALARGEHVWANSPQEREQSLASIEVIVAGTSRAGEAQELARARVVETEVMRTLFWYPWERVRVDPQSLGLLREAREAGRGVILSSCHLGPYYQTSSVGELLGSPVFALVGDWMLGEFQPGYWGRLIARRVDGMRTNGARILPAAGSFPVLLALLQAGESALIQFDVPGRERVQFLGKPVMMRTGTAKLSMQSGALVAPVRTRREGHHVWLDAAKPLDPHDFSDALEMHCALASLHEPWVLEYPQALEDPLRSGAWVGATPEGWPTPPES